MLLCWELSFYPNFPVSIFTQYNTTHITHVGPLQLYSPMTLSSIMPSPPDFKSHQNFRFSSAKECQPSQRLLQNFLQLLTFEVFSFFYLGHLLPFPLFDYKSLSVISKNFLSTSNPYYKRKSQRAFNFAFPLPCFIKSMDWDKAFPADDKRK